MRRYPRFLKTMPEFLGISFPEVGIILLSLWVCLILNIGPHFALIFSIGGILLFKVIKKNFDFIGFMVPRKKSIYLTDFKREDT